MYKNLITLLAVVVLSVTAQGQSLVHHWRAINDDDAFTSEYLDIKADSTYRFSLSEGAISSSGNWKSNRNHIVVKDTVQNKDFALLYENLTDTSMYVTMLGKKYELVNENSALAQAAQIVSQIDKAEESSSVLPSEGITFTGVLRGVIGLLVLVFVMWLLSDNRRAISWKLVIYGIGAQIVLAFCIQKVPFVGTVFEWISKAFVKILDFSKEGAEFIFGGLMDQSAFGYIFAFQVLPTIIFFSALTSVLFYLGIIQKVVGAMAKVMTRLLGISGAESLSVTGNIFLGQTEAPLMIKPYLSNMNRSEILLVMVGGMSTLAGGVLAAYISFLGGDDPVLRQMFAKNLLMASVMAAPGAVVAAKMLCPQTEKIDNDVHVSMEKIGSNFLDAMSKGTSEGLKLAVNVAAMLVVFVAFIAMFNYIISGVSSLTGFDGVISNWTDGRVTTVNLQVILGAIFSPIMGVIGVPLADCTNVGSLLGLKVIMSEFVGYKELATFTAGNILLTNKAIVMSTFILSGFANFASIGIQIGGIGSLAPNKREVLAKFGVKALIAGTIASLLSATIAGALIG
ncbi:MAG: nucleoside transporter C-terminal domain-containing protein [Flavobacteriales bacterium]|nr:nucleoside transporter C-terminal domain-containing protein [Flavobacteriales bacterium]